MTAQEQLDRVRPELRYFRIHFPQIKKAQLFQKQRAERLEKELKQAQDEIKRLKEELEKTKKQRDKYKGMIFKPNIQETSSKGKLNKKLGGQLGHIGASRKVPSKVNYVKRIYFKHCPNCGDPLKRTASFEAHTVEDIPSLEEIKTAATSYESERQWCGNCGKEVVAAPARVIPNSRLGINLIIQILIWKYVCRMSFEIIVNTLFQTYGVVISVGGIINILKRTKIWLGKDYGELLSVIRASPVKHADETSWRIKGLSGWLWAFLTKDTVYYTIEHSRGKGVAEKVLSASSKDDVLVRDDYAGYKCLKLNHQSCWRHLLGESKEAIQQKGASKEVKLLHKNLKKLYQKLLKITTLSFDLVQRQTLYQIYEDKLKQIINATYTSLDSQKIQTRIRNQRNNLITALLFPDVPLTNNLAERQIRPAVVVRKISGGSRSEQGAETFAVNFSVIQTLRMRNQPLIPTLHNLLLKGSSGKF